MTETPTPAAAAPMPAAVSVPTPPPSRAVPAPESVARVRRLYQDGEPVAAIRAATGLDRRTFYACLDGQYPDGSGVAPAALPRRRPVPRPARRSRRAALVEKIWKTAARQVNEIERQLAAAGLAIPERESHARTLAIVARTLRELSAVEEAQNAVHAQTANDDHADDDPVPRDIEEFRRELARRIHAIVDRTRHDGGGELPGAG